METKDLILVGLSLLGALAMIIWNMLNSKIEHNHKNLNTRINETNEELGVQRGNIAKVFDKLEEHNRLSTERHIEILQYLRDRGH
jgi:hypothetical protein